MDYFFFLLKCSGSGVEVVAEIAKITGSIAGMPWEYQIRISSFELAPRYLSSLINYSSESMASIVAPALGYLPPIHPSKRRH